MVGAPWGGDIAYGGFNAGAAENSSVRVLRREPRAPERGGDRIAQRGDVVGALVAAAVDEERRRAGDAAGVRAGHVVGDPRHVDVAADLVPEAVAVEAELGGVAVEVARVQLVG